MRSQLLSFTILICLPLVAVADPSADVLALMREPATMFDCGMLRLELRTMDFCRSFLVPTGLMTTPNISSGYDWTHNRIEIQMIAHAIESATRDGIIAADPMQNPIHHAFITGRRIDGKTDWPFFRN